MAHRTISPVLKRIVDETLCRDQALVFALALILVGVRVFLHPLSSMDELWPYQYSRHLLAGHKPYLDFYMLQLPFAAQFNALLLSLFGDQLIVLRSAATILGGATALMLYATCRRLGVSVGLSALMVPFFASCMYAYPHNSYTWYAVGFMVAALWLESGALHADPNNASLRLGDGLKAFSVGVLLGLCTLSKQNLGVLALAASLAFTAWGNLGRQQPPQLLRPALLKVAGWALVLAGEAWWLSGQGLMMPFLENTVFSLSSFSQGFNRPVAALFSDDFPIPLIVTGFGAVFIVMAWRALCSSPVHKQQAYRLVWLYGLANAGLIYPIADVEHLFPALPVAYVGLVLLLDEYLGIRRISQWPASLVNLTVLCALSLSLLLFALSSSFAMARNELTWSSLPRYWHIPVSYALERSLSEVGHFISEKQLAGHPVYLLTFRSAAYLIPLGAFGNKNDTMLGEFPDSEFERLKREIFSNPDAIVILDDYRNRVAERRLTECVRTHMVRCGTVSDFIIYRHANTAETVR